MTFLAYLAPLETARPVFRGRLVVGVLSHRVTQQSDGRGIGKKHILAGYPAVHILCNTTGHIIHVTVVVSDTLVF